MRRIPIPLLVAAVVATTAILVTLNVKVNPIPIYAEPNFTTVVPSGSYAVWKGAANEFTVESNTTGKVYVANGPFAAIYAPSGLPVNVTLGDKRYIVGTNKSFAYLVNIGAGEYAAFILKPVSNGFYVTDAVTSLGTYAMETTGENGDLTCQDISSMAFEKFSLIVWCYTGDFIANSTGFYITYVSAGGAFNTVKYNYVGSFNMGPSGVTIRGVSGGANINGYPVAWRLMSVLVLQPDNDARVTIYVK